MLLDDLTSVNQIALNHPLDDVQLNLKQIIE